MSYSGNETLPYRRMGGMFGYCYIGLCVVMDGYMWLWVVICGYMWLWMVICGYIGL